MSEYLYCRRATDHRFMQFKGLPKYNFRFKNAKKKSQARNRLLQYHVLSGPSIKKTPHSFLTKFLTLSFPFCKKPKVDYMLRTMLCSDRYYLKVIVHD